MDVDERLARTAGEVAERLALRAYDAVHLAAALEIAEIDILMVTWDQDLAAAARAAGLSVAP